MKTRNRQTAENVLSRYPEHYRQIAFQKFHFNEQLVFVNVRSKDLDHKPVLFMWSLDSNCFISSLFPIAGKNAFSLDVANKESGAREFYHLSVKEGGVVVEKQGGRL